MPIARVNDTDPAADAFHIRLLRDAGLPRRLALAFSLSATVIELARDAIRRALPGSSEEDVRLRFVELHYGADLARDVRDYISSQRR